MKQWFFRFLRRKVRARLEAAAAAPAARQYTAEAAQADRLTRQLLGK